MTTQRRILAFTLATLGSILLAPHLLAAEGADTLPTASQANVKLLTWNVQMLPTSVAFASRSLQKMQHLRAPWIIEHLNAQNYDVLVLQEVIDPKVTELLKQGLKTRYPYMVAPPSKAGVSGTTGGILFASRIPLKYRKHIVFQNIAGIDRLAEKGCVLVEAEQAGIRFQIAGTHLQAGHSDVRERQFTELFERIIKPYREDGVPQILTGDLNVAADTAEGSTFQRLLTTTQMQAFPIDDPRPFTVDGKNSWNRWNKIPLHIDHVLLNPRGTATTIVRQTIQRPRRDHDGTTIDYADHYGVVAEIVLKK